MSYSNISDILTELNNKDANNQKSALALSNTSELEIKNLLKQIDTMIHHKKLRWERQKQDLDNKLQIKEQEFQTQRISLEQKNNEIGQLRKLLESMESTTKEIMKKYEKEISTLHQQLSKIKSDYLRVHKKYKKNSNKEGSSESHGPINDENCPNGPEIATTEFNTNNFNKLNINQKVINSNSISSISNDFFQLDSSFSESATSSTLNLASKSTKYDFNKKLIETKLVSKSKLQNFLTNEENLSYPKAHNDMINNLKQQLSECKLKEDEFYKEKEKLAKVLDHYKRINQELNKKCEDLVKQKKNNFLINENLSEIAQTDKLNLDYYKMEIRKRDEYIRNLEALDKADNIELQFYKDEVKKYKKQESAFTNEICQMKKEYDEAKKSLALVENEIKKIKNKLESEIEAKAKSEELLNKRLDNEKNIHKKEVNNLKDEIVSAKNQLVDKNNQIKALFERINCLEKLLKEKEAQLTKENQELVMTVAHVEALRLENHFLRQSLVERKSDEKEIAEMQKKYHHVLELTEKENKRLKNEVVSLSECIESLKSKQNHMILMAKQNGNENNKKNANNLLNSNSDILDTRRSDILRHEYEKQIETLKFQHELSVKRLNNEIEKLYGEKHSLQIELESKAHYLNKINNSSNNNLQKSTNRSNTSSGGDQISSNSLSMGTISSNHVLSIISPTSNHNDALKESNKIKKRTSNNLEPLTANKNNRLHNHHARSSSNQQRRHYVNSDLENINEVSPTRSLINHQNHKDQDAQQNKNQAPRYIFSNTPYDDEQRKKNLDNLLDTHIESLRRSSLNEHFFSKQ